MLFVYTSNEYYFLIISTPPGNEIGGKRWNFYILIF